MPTPADDLAQLLAAVLAYRPQPWAWPRPRPAYLPHPCRRLARLRGVVWIRSRP
jgi:hypothetical protein